MKKKSKLKKSSRSRTYLADECGISRSGRRAYTFRNLKKEQREGSKRPLLERFPSLALTNDEYRIQTETIEVCSS